jgi:plasmid stability protein
LPELVTQSASELAVVSACVPPAMRDELRARALASERTVSGEIRRLLRDALAREASPEQYRSTK